MSLELTALLFFLSTSFRSKSKNSLIAFLPANLITFQTSVSSSASFPDSKFAKGSDVIETWPH